MDTFSDIEVTQDGRGGFDFTVGDSGDFVAEFGLDSALYVSFFTDARADSTQVSDPARRRGWLGNLVPPVAERQLGGLLWLSDQSRLNTATLNFVVSNARLALDWFVQDGLADNIEVVGQMIPLLGIALTITIKVPDGSVETRYVKLWEVTGNAA